MKKCGVMMMRNAQLEGTVYPSAAKSFLVHVKNYQLGNYFVDNEKFLIFFQQF